MKGKKAVMINRYVDDVTPPSEGVQFTTSAPTPLLRNQGVLVPCDCCGISFKKAASHIKRTAHNYCGWACSNAARINRIRTACCVCGTPMEKIPSALNKVRTCSDACSKARKRAVENLAKPADSVFIPRIPSYAWLRAVAARIATPEIVDTHLVPPKLVEIARRYHEAMVAVEKSGIWHKWSNPPIVQETGGSGESGLAA